MITDAIYSFKLLNHYKPLDDTFFKLAKLAIFSSKKHFTTVLVTDEKSYKFLKDGGLEFDKVVFSEAIESYRGVKTCMPKLFSMMEMENPYIHLDFDSILIDKPESLSPISFPFPEPDLTNLTNHNIYNFIYWGYVEPFEGQVLDKIDYQIQQRIKWDIFPNNSALIVNKPKIVAEIYKEIIKDFTSERIEKLSESSVEQQYFLSYLRHYGIEYDFRSKNDTFTMLKYRTLSDKEKYYYLEGQRYVHISNYHWWPELTLEVLEFFKKKLNYR